MIHRQQFIAKYRNTETFAVSQYIESFSLNNGYWDLLLEKNTVFKQSKIGKSYVLIGSCFSLRKIECASDLLDECFSIDDVYQKIEFLGGRWVLFWDEYVLTDFSGNYQLFYGGSSGLIVSSSLFLLSRELNIKVCPDRCVELEKLGFFPGPETIYMGLQLLFSFQQIKGKNVKSRPFEIKIIEKNLDYLLNEFTLITKIFLQNIQNENYRILLPLTGGVDSRTIFAFLRDLKIKFTSYTTWYAGINLHDLLVPKILSIFSYKLEYNLIKPSEYNNVKMIDFNIHTGRNCVDKDREFYSTNSYPQHESLRTIMLRGAGWAPFRGYYTKDLEDKSKIEERLNEIMKILPQLNQCDHALISLKNWLNLLVECKNLDWRYQYYLDQRMNAWDGALEQAIELAGYQPIQLVNNHLQVELLYSCYKLDSSVNRSNHLQRRIIFRLNPLINLLPYNFFKNWKTGIKGKLAIIIKNLF